MNKRTVAIWLAIVASLIIAAVWISYALAAPRSKVAADSMARLKARGQEIVDAAFPGRIGPAPFRNVVLNGVEGRGDGYQVVATLYYSNILLDENYMEIEMNYDAGGAFVGARIQSCNDRWASPDTLIDLSKR